jgi:TrpR-related protein YerC/YecD
MPRYNSQAMTNKEKRALIDELYGAVQTLQSKQDILDFFRDLLTESESIMLARRLEIAKMLLEERSFLDIKVQLKAGFDTINAVRRWLEHGHGGYRRVIERLYKSR